MTTTNTDNPAFDQAFVPNFKAGMSRLTREERTYLKHLITPEAAFLLAKAFGPEMSVYLWPFIAEDSPSELPGPKNRN